MKEIIDTIEKLLNAFGPLVAILMFIAYILWEKKKSKKANNGESSTTKISDDQKNDIKEIKDFCEVLIKDHEEKLRYRYKTHNLVKSTNETVLKMKPEIDDIYLMEKVRERTGI